MSRMAPGTRPGAKRRETVVNDCSTYICTYVRTYDPPASRATPATLASLISEKHGQPYSTNSTTISWIRCRISFSLIDSAVACLRAPRSSRHAPVREIDLIDQPLDLFHAEVQSVE